MQFGVGLFGGFEPDRFKELVSLIERVGFAHLWVADEGLYRNPYAALAVAALSSARLQLGTGVTNPYTRHPALTGAAIATIDELSGGRAVLGLGAGGSGPLALGIAKPRPVLAVRDTVAIVNALTETGSVDYTGPVTAFRGSLDFKPLRRVPIYLAATGTQMLRLAGTVADGVIIGDGATESVIRDALRHVESGALRTERRLKDLRVVTWLATAISNDRGQAVEAVRKIVAVAVMNHRHRLAEIGVKLSHAMSAVLERHKWTRTPASVEELSQILTDEVIDTFSLAGSVEECLARVRRFAKLPITQVGVLFRPPKGSTMEEQIRLFADRVLDRF